MVSDDPESFADLDGHYTVSGLGEFGGQGCTPSMKLCEEQAQENQQNQQQPAQPPPEQHVDPQAAANAGIAKDLVNNGIQLLNVASAFLFGDAAAGLGYEVPKIPELQPSNKFEGTAMTATEVVLVGATLLTGEGEVKAVSVYQKVETAYVGITKNLAQRELQHGEQLEKIVGGLTRNQARGVEQAIIEQKGLAKNGGALTNKINSISRANPMYKAAVEFGRQILKSVGF